MKQNKLTLNEDRTELMVFKNENCPSVKLSISRDSDWKHLKNEDV